MPYHITQDNQSIFYRSTGTGATILFIHGWANSSHAWRLQIPFFSSSYRVVTVDLRGHGYSSKCSGPYSMSRFASDINELVRFLKVEKHFIVGWSMGSMVALEYANEYRDSVAGAVLVGSTPCFLKKENVTYGAHPATLKRLRLNLNREYTKQISLYCDNLFYRDKYLNKPQESIIKDILFGAGANFPPPEKVALETLTALEDWDARNWLSSIKCPVFIVHGKEDAVVDVRAAAALQKQIEGATTRLFNEIGHAPFLTVPDLFNKTVNDFLCVQSLS